jgi:hypothetical protein
VVSPLIARSLGAEGWELVAIEDDWLYLKRPHVAGIPDFRDYYHMT